MTTHRTVATRTVRRLAAALITVFAALSAGCAGASTSIPPVPNPGTGGGVQRGL